MPRNAVNGNYIMRARTGSVAVGLLTALLLVSSSAAPAGAQVVTRPRFGVGYVAAAPDLMMGVGAYAILPAAGGIGLYVDAKFDASDPGRKSNFDPSLTAQQVEASLGDAFGLSADSWRAIDVAILRPLRPSLTLYAGGGYARKKRYNEYYDATGTRGLVGHYWVEDTAQAKSSVNVMAGLFFRMSRFLNAQMGVESAPGSVTVGLSLALPPQ